MGVVVQGDPDLPQGAHQPRDVTPVPPFCVYQGRQSRERRALLAGSPEVQGKFSETFEMQASFKFIS
jgi:hypothetical protein